MTTDVANYDLLIVGAGPAGAAAAYWAAKRGLEVLAVDKQHFPRDKTCGDGLTPRAVKELSDMGLDGAFAGWHRHKGLRVRAHGAVLELPWPSHPVYPDYGFVVRRRDLDSLVAERARSAGAVVRHGVEAVKPLWSGDGARNSASDNSASAAEPNGVASDREFGRNISGDGVDGSMSENAGSNVASVSLSNSGKLADSTSGELAGAVLRDKTTGETEQVKARYVIVADGANSRFGRALGTKRDRGLAQGMAIRTYYASPAHDDPWIESALDITDRQGNTLPGYGWVFPLGDGKVNVGIGLLSTFRDYKSVNTSWLMEEWAHTLPDFWGVDPTSPEIAPVGGRLPMGGSVQPKAGANWLVAGDAAGTVNPFNGEGIDYAYETGRAAADIIASALARNDPGILSEYPRWLETAYGLYFRVGHLFAKAIGNPDLIRRLTAAGMQSQTFMEWALRIMANLLRPDELKPAELAYAAMKALAKAVPESKAKIS